MQAGGATLLRDFRGLSVTGLTEALRVIPRSWQTYRALVRAAELEPPDVFVPIDFVDFNAFLTRALHKRRVPVVYYISPQIWAWRPGRIKTVKRVADRMLVIFPFEVDFYERAGVPVTFVGHPLLELMPAATPRDTFLRGHGLDPGKPVVAILPGSRSNEVREILPNLVAASALVAATLPGTQFVLGRAPRLHDELFEPLSRWPSSAPPPLVLEGATDDILASADVALLASGTVTVQAALHTCPMVVVYRLGAMTYRLGRPLVQVETYAMANLVAGQRVVPELIQDAFTPDATAQHALAVLTDPAYAARVRGDLASVRARLGTPGASRRAAEAILDIARKRTR
jgi:lipid-A-disaccharide synthase